MTPRILVLTGEPSGDLHGARVASALTRRFPGATIDAVGGRHLAATGATMVESIEGLSAMGLVEVLHTLPAHLRLRRALRRRFRAGAYDLVIPIDYPGFHFLVAEDARRTRSRCSGTSRRRYGHGDLTALVVSPDVSIVWRSSSPSRQHSSGVPESPPSTWVTRSSIVRERRPATRHGPHSISHRPPACSHSSRARERVRSGDCGHCTVTRHGDFVRKGACDRIVIAATAWGEYPGSDTMDVVRDDPALVLASADAVFAKSGTTTLEAALAAVPMVVAYQVHPITYRLLRSRVTARWISLVNLVADREVVPELVQDDVTVDRLAHHGRLLLDTDSPEGQAQRAGLAIVRERLGAPGASERVATIAAEVLAA